MFTGLMCSQPGSHVGQLILSPSEAILKILNLLSCLCQLLLQLRDLLLQLTLLSLQLMSALHTHTHTEKGSQEEHTCTLQYIKNYLTSIEHVLQ